MDSIEPRPPLLRPHGEAPYELLDGCFIVPCGSCGKKNSCCRDAGCHFGKDSERVDELTYVDRRCVPSSRILSVFSSKWRKRKHEYVIIDWIIHGPSSSCVKHVNALKCCDAHVDWPANLHHRPLAHGIPQHARVWLGIVTTRNTTAWFHFDQWRSPLECPFCNNVCSRTMLHSSNRLKLLKPWDWIKSVLHVWKPRYKYCCCCCCCWSSSSSLPGMFERQACYRNCFKVVWYVWFMFDSCLIFSPSRKFCTKGGGSHTRSLSPSCWKMKKSKSCHNLKTCPCLFWPQAETVRNSATKKGNFYQISPSLLQCLPLLSSLHQPLQLDPCNHGSRLSTVFTWLSQYVSIMLGLSAWSKVRLDHATSTEESVRLCTASFPKKGCIQGKDSSASPSCFHFCSSSCRSSHLLITSAAVCLNISKCCRPKAMESFLCFSLAILCFFAFGLATASDASCHVHSTKSPKHTKGI